MFQVGLIIQESLKGLIQELQPKTKKMHAKKNPNKKLIDEIQAIEKYSCGLNEKYACGLNAKWTLDQ